MPLNNKQFSYRSILKRSLEIAKKHKFLWFFGFFAAFLGVGGEFESLFKSYSEIGATSEKVFSLNYLYQGGFFWSVAENIRLFFGNYPWQALFFFLMIMVITVVVIWLAIVSQIALFDSANRIAKNKKANYSDGYHAGNRHFGSVLMINIIVKIVLWGIFTVIATPLLSWFILRNNAWGGILFMILLFFFFIPVSIIVSFVVKYAVAYVVIKDYQLGDAVRQGWQLFKKNWLVSVEMAVIILALGILAGLVILFALGLASVPFILIAITGLFFGSGTTFSLAIIIGMIAWFIIISIIGAAFVAYQYTAWTLLFLELIGDKAESKLARWFNKLSPAN